MHKRRPSSAPLCAFDRMNFATRRFEDCIDTLTEDSIAQSLEAIEAMLKDRYSVSPAPRTTKTRRAVSKV